jgi:hypothetical protein
MKTHSNEVGEHAVHDEPAAALPSNDAPTYPTEGGSYTRKPDGSLEKVSE